MLNAPQEYAVMLLFVISTGAFAAYRLHRPAVSTCQHMSTIDSDSIPIIDSFSVSNNLLITQPNSSNLECRTRASQVFNSFVIADHHF